MPGSDVDRHIVSLNSTPAGSVGELKVVLGQTLPPAQPSASNVNSYRLLSIHRPSSRSSPDRFTWPIITHPHSSPTELRGLLFAFDPVLHLNHPSLLSYTSEPCPTFSSRCGPIIPMLQRSHTICTSRRRPVSLQLSLARFSMVRPMITPTSASVYPCSLIHSVYSRDSHRAVLPVYDRIV